MCTFTATSSEFKRLKSYSWGYFTEFHWILIFYAALFGLMETKHFIVTVCWVCITSACCKPARLFWYKSSVRSKLACYICTFLRVRKDFSSPPFVFAEASCQHCRVILCCESAMLSKTCHCGNFTITEGQMFFFFFFFITAIWKRSTWNTTFDTRLEFPVITKTQPNTS